VPNTGPDEPPTVDMHVMPMVFSASFSLLPSSSGSLARIASAPRFMFRPTVAVADRRVELGEFLDVVDQRLRARPR
jgi:hypothetical protein